MDTITSLNRLTEVLQQSNAEDYVKIAKNMSIPVSDFTQYAYWKEDGYARNCIIKTAAFELILICWKEGDSTPIHGHNNQKCWVYLVDGNMTEIRYQKDDQENLTECNKMQISAGNLTYMHDNMGYHLLKNALEKKAMTLHLYMKPVESCEVFNPNKNCFETKELCFDTVDGEKAIPLAQD